MNNTGATIKDADFLPLYNVQQKETVSDVDINPELSEVQTAELKQLLNEYKQIFSDVPTVTHLIAVSYTHLTLPTILRV